MALIDKASLLMVPSTYEAGKLYNVLPSGNRAPDSTDQNSGYDQTRADFDFDRGSNAAASRINSSGLIEKYRENKLLQSNQFDTTWINIGTSVTSNKTGYDGSNDAWLLSKSAVSARVQVSLSISGIKTISLYAKANESAGVTIRLDGGTNPNVKFDLVNGVLFETNGDVIEAKIEPVGNDWYRCSMSTNNAATFLRIYPLDSSGSTAPTSGSLYIQNAQVETGLVATDYLNSTSVTGKAGVLVDLPRINYDANGENGALLLEPSRANVYPYSEPFLGSGQTTNVSTYLNGDAFGIGVYGGVQLVAGSTKYYYQFSSAASTQYAVSFFVRRTDGGLPRIGTYAQDANGDFCIVASGSVKAPNDWDTTPTITLFKEDVYKFEGVLTTPALTGNFGHIKYSGNSAIDVQITGLQAEPNASYVSSYIPNHGTSGGVTRAADSCSVTGASDVIPNEGVFYAELNALDDDNTNRVFTLNDGSTANRVQMYFNTSNQIVGGISASGSGQANIEYTIDIKSFLKVAFKYKTNDFALWVNGVKVGEDLIGNAPTGLNAISSDNTGGTLPFYGNVKQLAVFNEALTDAELATLTTL